jgi:hypothetical protein
VHPLNPLGIATRNLELGVRFFRDPINCGAGQVQVDGRSLLFDQQDVGELVGQWRVGQPQVRLGWADRYLRVSPTKVRKVPQKSL